MDDPEDFVKIRKNRLEDIVERKVEEKLENRNPETGQENNGDVSRRDFLKKLGAGAAGLGALSLAPAASQLKLTKNGISSSSDINLSNTVKPSSLGGTLTRGQTVNRISSGILNEISASGDSTIEFTNNIDSSFQTYMIRFSGVKPSTDAKGLNLQVTADGGSSWENGSSDYKYAGIIRRSDGTSAAANDTGTSTFSVQNGGVGDGSSESTSGYILISSASDSNLYTQFITENTYSHWDNATEYNNRSGEYRTANTVDGVRLYFDSGNVSSGKFSLIGKM